MVVVVAYLLSCTLKASLGSNHIFDDDEEKNMKPKFNVEVADTNGRKFHTDVEIFKDSIESFRPGSWNQCRSQLRDRLGNPIGDMVFEILLIKGVDGIFLHPYEVCVFMKDGFKWNENIGRIVFTSVCQLADEKYANDQFVGTETRGQDREYHLKTLVSHTSIEDFRRPLRDSSERYLNEVGYPGNQIIKKLFDIPGVIEVWVHPYYLSVEIAKMFNWEESSPKIEKAFEDVLGPLVFKYDSNQ